ncbi:MAG TPA: PIN domain-containing protein [Gaiellaceae bacterium]|nr:PIN domain-containing protein [Gaiellaceae bacterium]
MPTAYVDTSVLGRVLLDEPDAPAILDELDRFDDIVSSRLLTVELRRLALRRGFNERATELLADVLLLPVDEAILAAAEIVTPAAVATLDAIHLVTALRLAEGGDLDALMTYDARLADAASHHGLRVLAPRR